MHGRLLICCFYGGTIAFAGVNGKLSEMICESEILHIKISIDSSRFYIKFYNSPRPFFGFNGSTF
ncbi:unnamed protein product [Brassica rapa]|uniref:Secreted protein n=1 Tax=Brassica campestris TaxID=3711 RepID=A0A8D9H6G5_BRACM|nr:unnamed protein product [Brassica rapa]